MTHAQQLFAIFYAVLYGTMLTSLGGLRCFQWGFPAAENTAERSRLAGRLFLSLLCLNLAPFAIFAAAYTILGARPEAAPNYVHIFCVAIAALSVYAPYRLYHLCMVVLRKTPLAPYTNEEYEEFDSDRNIRASWLGHLLGTLFYAALFFLVLV
jgi:hypothetical protein